MKGQDVFRTWARKPERYRFSSTEEAEIFSRHSARIPEEPPVRSISLETLVSTCK
jgi:hypothetical protein